MVIGFSLLGTLSRAKSSFREVSNFFQPVIPIERRVMKTSMAGLAEALKNCHFNLYNISALVRRLHLPG